MMKKTFLFMVLAGVMVGLSLYGYPALAADEIKIGSIWPMTGPGATWGQPFHNVIQYQADQINAKGGLTVGGKKYLIKIFKEDTKYVPSEARKVTEKLIYQDKVKFILGPLGGGELNAIKNILNENKVINVVVINAFDAIGPDKPYCFRAFMGVGETYLAFLEYLRDKLGVKTLQKVDWDTESGRSGEGEVAASCRILGIKQLESIWYPPDTKDFYPSMTKIVANNPDLIITGGPTPHQALQMKVARELGYKGIMATSTPTLAADLIKVVDKKVIEGYYTQVSIVEGPMATPAIKKWKAEWEATGKPWVDSGGLVTVNFLPLVLQGIQKAGTVDDTDKIKAALQSLVFESPVFGPCKWGGKERYGINHNIIYPVHISKVVDGKDVGVYIVPPEKIRVIVR
jgi:branched-chain amino acid transport system substrate-binding protein